MPLLDHFRPPIRKLSRWEGFHSQWATAMVTQLNGGAMPARYHAEARLRLGGGVEVDTAAVEREAQPPGGDVGNGVATAVWAPPKPELDVAADFADQDLFEVRLIDHDEDRLVAAIELASPSNKDRPDNRRTFAVKCAGYLQAAVSVVLIDVVTERRANLHAELMDLLGVPAGNSQWQSPTGLYVTAYRTIPRPEDTNRRARLQGWFEPLALAGTLPTVPLWLGEDLVVPLGLEQSYAAACGSLRLT
jgi:hypothetical protein